MNKVHLLLFTFIIVLLTGNSYSSEKKETPEELKKQLTIVKEPQKTNILLKLADHYEYDDDKSIIFEYANKALTLSKKHMQKEEEIDSLGYISKYYRRKKMYKEAFKFADLRLKKSKEYKFPLKEVYALTDIGYIFYKKQEHEKALEYGNNALKLAENLKNMKAQIYALDEIITSIPNNYLKVLSFMKKRKIITDKFGDKKEMAHSTHLLASIHFYLNDIESSKKLYLKAMKLYESTKKYARVIQLKSYIGNFLKKQEKYDQGLKYLFDAQKYYLNIKKKDKGIERSYGRIINRIGEIYFEKKDYKKAIEYYKILIVHAKKIKDEWLDLMAHDGLVDLYIELKKYNIAKEYIQKCFNSKYGTENGIWKDKFNISLYSKLGKICFESENYNRSIKIYKKNLINAKKYFYMETVSEIYKQLGEIYIKKNDFKLALENIMLSIEYSENHNKTLLIPKNKILKEDYKILSGIYKKMGNKKLEQKYQKLYNSMVENPNQVI